MDPRNEVIVTGEASADVITIGLVSKESLGLGNVDDTSDADKPVSDATQAQLDLKIFISDIVDDLTTVSADRPLSASQGKVLKDLIDNLTTLLESDDTTLDELQEVVNFIKLNRETLESLSIPSIAGLQVALDLKASIAYVDGRITTSSAADRDRANHTGTQPASSISDFNTAVAANATVAANTAARHAHGNKALLDTYDQTNANIADAVAKKHAHANQAVLDDTTAAFKAADRTKLDGIEAGAEANDVTSVAGRSGAVSLTKSDVGLANVDNTSDAGKPISTATQTALDGKAAALHGHPASQISDSTATGRSVLTGADAATIRGILGLGTVAIEASTAIAHLAGAETFTGNKTFNTGVVINESGADSDTRIEGDTDPNTVYVDASTNNVGFGTTTPVQKNTLVGLTSETPSTATGDLGFGKLNGTNSAFGWRRDSANNLYLDRNSSGTDSNVARFERSTGAVAFAAAISAASLSLTSALAIAYGGTGATTAVGARANLVTQSKISITVGPSGDLGYITPGTNDHTFIQAAIDAASAAGAGVVRLQAGTTYDVGAAIQLKPNVALIGGGWTTVLRSKNGLNSFPLQATVANAVDNVMLKDFKVDMNGPNQTNNGWVALTAITRYTIDHVWLTNSRTFGLLIQPSGDAITGVQSKFGLITNCQFDVQSAGFDYAIMNTQYSRIVHNYFGAMVTGGGTASNYALSAGRSMRHTIIANNTFLNTGNVSIGIEDVEDVQVIGNNIEGAGSHGIFVTTFQGEPFRCRRVVIADNVVSGCGNDGINVGGGNGNGSGIFEAGVISGNTCFNNSRNGISLYATMNSTIADNICYNNNQGGNAAPVGAGIRFSGGSPVYNTVVGNKCYDVGRFGSFTTAFGTASANLTFTAKNNGVSSVTVAYTDPGSPSQPLSVSVVGNAISVSLATNASGVITSTAADVKAAVEASAPAAALVVVGYSGNGNGAGTVAAMAAQALAGGAAPTQTYGIYNDVNGDYFTVRNNTAYGNTTGQIAVYGPHNDVNGNMGPNGAVRTITGTSTGLVTDDTVLADAAAGSLTYNLPQAATCAGHALTAKKTDASANAVTLDGNGAETIDGALTYALSAQWSFVTIRSNGTSWFITAKG